MSPRGVLLSGHAGHPRRRPLPRRSIAPSVVRVPRVVGHRGGGSHRAATTGPQRCVGWRNAEFENAVVRILGWNSICLHEEVAMHINWRPSASLNGACQAPLLVLALPLRLAGSCCGGRGGHSSLLSRQTSDDCSQAAWSNHHIPKPSSAIPSLSDLDRRHSLEPPLEQLASSLPQTTRLATTPQNTAKMFMARSEYGSSHCPRHLSGRP